MHDDLRHDVRRADVRAKDLQHVQRRVHHDGRDHLHEDPRQFLRDAVRHDYDEELE
jgi:hypothetical protein